MLTEKQIILREILQDEVIIFPQRVQCIYTRVPVTDYFVSVNTDLRLTNIRL